MGEAAGEEQTGALARVNAAIATRFPSLHLCYEGIAALFFRSAEDDAGDDETTIVPDDEPSSPLSRLATEMVEREKAPRKPVLKERTTRHWMVQRLRDGEEASVDSFSEGTVATHQNVRAVKSGGRIRLVQDASCGPGGVKPRSPLRRTEWRAARRREVPRKRSGQKRSRRGPGRARSVSARSGG